MGGTFDGRILLRSDGEGALDIETEFYTFFLERSVRAVREFDPSFDEVHERAWRDVLGCAVEVMRSRD